MSAGNGNGNGRHHHDEHAPNRMAALIEQEQAALKDKADYADTYAPLDRNSFRALGKRLEEPLDVVPPFLPALASACRSWGGGKGWAKGWNVVMGARTGHGKALALETPILTTAGWRTMGTVGIGDFVFDERGVPCRIVNATPVMEGRPCYSVVFDDGHRVVADADHQWLTHDARRHPSVVTTEDIFLNLRTRRRLHRVHVAPPPILPEQTFTVHPYVLGVWLGDGTKRTGMVTAHIKDAGELAAYLRECGEDVICQEVKPGIVRLTVGGMGQLCRRGHPLRVLPVRKGKRKLERCLICARHFQKRGRDGTPVPPRVRFTLKERLRELNLLCNKHIPDAYLTASMGQRIALLQGLMDTDGCVSAGRCEFTSTNHRLAAAVHELALSLGTKATLIEGWSTLNGIRKGIKYRVCFTAPPGLRPFRLERKARLVKAGGPRALQRSIVRVERVDSVPVRCIEVDSPSHLFLCGKGLIPTHNSIFGGMVATHAAEHGIRAAIHSTEMEFEDNQLRVLAQCTGTELWKLEPGAQFIRAAFDRAVREFEERSQGRLILNKLRHRTLPAVLDGMRRSWEYDGCELHVIDYVQLMATGVKGYYSEDINARMSEISYGIVLTTEDLGLVSVSLSQFNRDGIRSAQRPEPYMLMGGSALENDAKQILLMDHTRTIDAEGGDASWLLIAKSRIGPAGPRFDIPIHRSHKNLRIRERLSDEVDESELFNPQATVKRK